MLEDFWTNFLSKVMMNTYLDKIIYKAAYCFFLQRFIVNIQNLDFSHAISL